MRTYILSLFAALMMSFPILASETDGKVVCPNSRQLEWAEAEIGVIFHLDMPVFNPSYIFREWGTHPDARTFNPSELDTD